ncbi:allantoinase [Pseudolabrys sp. Root1462]|uniref:dihydroorotase n=1 Tax=Pseudolabrys sp. Root1462 TaxID=1736466 RepID=UPI0007032DAC|nr:dihydroorotase family protein [Pseudolabrys sp. Root1462]KQZ01617.1 allantoinase [Pseudolabrys sp. Root1462]
MSATKADLVVANGRIVTPDSVFEGSIAIKDGKVLAVGDLEAMPLAAELFDAAGMHILPGAIDDHVHFRDPGYPHKEDWESGTAAAAFGGVTCVFDMPNTIPPTANGEILAAKHAIAASKAHIDFGLYGLLGDNTIATVPELIAGGVIGFKLYMGNTFGKIPSPDTGATLECFEVAAATGKRVSLHAENNDIMERRQKRLMAAGRKDQWAHLAARPSVVAIEAVSRAAILAEWTGARIHVLHISTAEELRPLREAKARGVDITGETCPHYLLLSTDDYNRVPGIIAVNPPVREKQNQQPIFDALIDGTIDVIATDHAPHAYEEKTRNDIWTVDCGFPGVETQMPLMLTQVNAGRMSITDYVRMSAYNPARIWGLYPRKGALLPGSDADIAIVDLGREHTIRDAETQSRSKVSPWDGYRVKGLPIHTLVRGRFVMKDRKLVGGTKGWGRSVHAIQDMPEPAVMNAEHSMHAITRP